MELIGGEKISTKPAGCREYELKLLGWQPAGYDCTSLKRYLTILHTVFKRKPVSIVYFKSGEGVY